jgi:hypothetical protein
MAVRVTDDTLDGAMDDTPVWAMVPACRRMAGHGADFGLCDGVLPLFLALHKGKSEDDKDDHVSPPSPPCNPDRRCGGLGDSNGS